MKAVILAGGYGTRLSEETILKPKPMVEIGGKPILWHIMKIYSAHGINDFIICLGYKGYIIKEYFANYFLHMSDVTFDIGNNKMEVHEQNAEYQLASLVIRISGMTQKFTTRNRFVPGQTLTLSLVDGPFRRLTGEWSFEPLGGEGSKVTLALNFEFSNRVLSSAFRRGFTHVADHTNH